MRYVFLLGFAFLLATAGAGSAMPLDRWKVSCKADAGSIKRERGSYTFTTSRNYCTGGVWKQRAEIFTDPVKPNHKGTYVFSTRLKMQGQPGHLFSLFSVHDARQGCAPPFQLMVRPNGRLWAASDIKTGAGESCIRGELGRGESKARLKMNGEPQDLKILIDFDGTGAFDMAVWLDDVVQISGRYQPSPRATVTPEKYYFKHGVYSPEMFQYRLVSEGMSVRKARLR